MTSIQENQITEKQFWNATSIFIKNLPSIHRKLCAAIDVQKYQILNEISRIDRKFLLKENINHENFHQKLCDYKVQLNICDPINNDNLIFNLESNLTAIQGIILLKKLILKSLKADVIYCLQIVGKLI